MINHQAGGQVHRKELWQQRLVNILILLAILTAVALALYRRALNSPGSVVPVPTITPTNSPAIVTPLDFTGQIAFKCRLASNEETLCVLDPATGIAGRLENSSLYEQAKAREAFSPLGNRMVFSQRSALGHNIFMRDVLSGWIDQLTYTSGADSQPILSPTGDLVAYISQAERGSAVWLYDLRQQTARLLIDAEGVRNEHPTFSPTGDRIVFASDREGSMALYQVESGGGPPQRLSPPELAGWDPVWIKPPIRDEQAGIPPDSEDALGVGLTLDPGLCVAQISAGDSSGAAPVTRVVLMVGDLVIHDSGQVHTTLYQAEVNLPMPHDTYHLVLQAWNDQLFAQTPRTTERNVVCLEPTPIVFLQPTVVTAFTPTLTPVVVTPNPTAADVFEAATRAAEAEALARRIGSPTPTPPNLITATPSPTPPIIVNTPTPANAATADYQSLFATAAAATTGTPTPLPAGAITATPVPTHTPSPAPTLTPQPSATPVFRPWDPARAAEPTTTSVPPIPDVLRGHILFRSSRDGDNGVFVMAPDGTGIARLTSPWPYESVKQSERLSSDGKFMAFVRQDANGPQIFFHDFQYGVDKQVTVMGAGSSWDPVFDETGWRIAFVSNEPGNDEIFLINRDGTDLQRLTNNTWEWDHHPSWSPDGSQIVFASNRSGRRQLYIMSADGQNVHLISDQWAEDWDPVWVK